MRLLFRSITAIGLLAVTGTAYAQSPQICPFGFLSCVSDMSGYVQSTIIERGLTTAFIGILTAMLIFYGVKLALYGSEENAVTEARTAYTHVIYGAIMMSGAYLLAEAFVGGGGAVNRAPLEGIAFNIVAFLKAMLFAALIGHFFIQGARLIFAQEEGETTKAYSLIVKGIIGAMIVILANAMVEVATNKDISIVSTESIGIVNMLGGVFGLLAVIVIIVGGITFVISIQDSLKDRGRKLVYTGVIALIIVLASYALVRTFIF